jgi:hypothetical protein
MNWFLIIAGGFAGLATVGHFAIGSGSFLRPTLEASFDEGTSLLVKFIALNYAAFAIAQAILALASNIKNALFKLFQWMFWVLIALFAWLGA